MLCVICLENISIPFSFVTTDNLCKDNHVFCIGCIYEYIRFAFQLSTYTGTCKCPLDRKEFNLKSAFSSDAFDVIELNENVMKSLDPEEVISCSICENIKEIETKYKRKEYLDHWKSVHFGNDNHLSLLTSSTQDNYALIPPEFVTEEAIEQQYRIEQLMISILRIRDREQRSLILIKWKELWSRARTLRDAMFDSSWDEMHEKLEKEIYENQEKANQLFDIYQNEGRPRVISKYYGETEEHFNFRKRSWNGVDYNAGNLIEYIKYLKDKKIKYDKYVENNKRRKANRILRKR